MRASLFSCVTAATKTASLPLADNPIAVSVAGARHHRLREATTAPTAPLHSLLTGGLGIFT
ncbi:MAG: hypothetical protein OYI31_00395 [Chloroflexota bacterium]|nr:hypothetical protein [Chloroflexota bacterium]MDE3266913.1 hypothetical protein [Chloroflexota bacterium]